MSTGCLYGPVPSRRLGRSLGVDLVPWKTCTYDCLYCQLGATTCKTLERQVHTKADEVFPALETALRSIPRPDYISLAGSGEPTLNLELGAILRGVKRVTSIPVAVLTNGSLLHLPEVREALELADVVLPSLDAGDEEGFQRINRPHADLSFQTMVDGLGDFTAHFQGEVWLEVMLVAGLNDGSEDLQRIARLAEAIGPARTQINTVERPAATSDVGPVSAETLRLAMGIFPSGTEFITDPGPLAPMGSLSSDPENALIELLGRRPCRAQEAASGLGIAPLELLKHLHRLQASGQIEVIRQDGQQYFRASHRKP
ncbi:MAG: putative radical transcription regulator TrmB [Holophagaceae bacterium]|nr:putative radical transcription regulator TrmB [Holophagaceae bacterium]